MSDEDLGFLGFCGGCLKSIQSDNGYVLSCADFICERCISLPAFTQYSTCPACKNVNVNAVRLRQPPSEVAEMIANPALEIEKLFNLLKFQISHYKKMLNASNNVVSRLQMEKQTLLRNEQKLKAMLVDQPSSVHAYAQGNRQLEGLKWKDGSDQQQSSSFRRPPSAGAGTAAAPTAAVTTSWNNRPHTSGGSKGNYHAQREHISAAQRSPVTERQESSERARDEQPTPKRSQLPSPLLPPPSRPRSSSSKSLKRQRTPDHHHHSSCSSSSPYHDSPTATARSKTSMKRPNTTGSGRLRSPYLPYIRTPGKVVNLSQEDLK